MPGHGRALGAMKRCRTSASRQMLAQCPACSHSTLIPHSCGHLLCPHCQSHESLRWLERQQQLRVPCEYFLLTFTVPSELRALAFAHQRLFYAALMHSAWNTVKAFAANDKELKGTAGAVARATHAQPSVGLSPACAPGGPCGRHQRQRLAVAEPRQTRLPVQPQGTGESVQSQAAGLCGQ